MNIFVICTVRGATDEYKRTLESYVGQLESDGHSVHLPHRDTDQHGRGVDICRENSSAIFKAHEVHVFYSSKSQGTHFDLGVAFALNKPLIVVENEDYGPGKSFPRMLDEWESGYV